MKKYQIGPMPEPLDPALVELVRQVEIATIGHFRHRGFVHRSLMPVHPAEGTLAGPAVTVAIPGPCSALLHHAVGLLRPGDFLVIDRLGDDRHACLGGGVARAIRRSGCIGVVLDGPCTDPHEIIQEGLPLWCRGVSSITTRILDLGGSLNLPVGCGNVPVMAGDVVLADATGVLVMPRGEAAEAAEEALRREARTLARKPLVLAGAKLGELSGATRMVMADQEQQA